MANVERVWLKGEESRTNGALFFLFTFRLFWLGLGLGKVNFRLLDLLFGDCHLFEAFPAEEDVLHLASYFREIGHAAGASGHQLLNLLKGNSVLLGRVDPYPRVLHPLEAHLLDASVVVHEVAGGPNFLEAAKAHLLKEGDYLGLEVGAPARQLDRDRGGRPLLGGGFAQTLTVDAVDGEEAGVA